MGFGMVPKIINEFIGRIVQIRLCFNRLPVLPCVNRRLNFRFYFQAYYNSDIGLWEFGTTITTACMFIMLTQVAIETKSWVSTSYVSQTVL